MSNQHAVSYKHHSLDESATEPLLTQNNTGNGNNPTSSSTGNNDTTTTTTTTNNAQNGSSGQAKTVRIADGDKNKNQNNEGDGEGGVNRRYVPVGIGRPPDGGWGWVVVLSSFAISMLVDGVCFSFGIFFDEFRHEFGGTKAETSWIGSVLNGTYLAVGPVVSALVNVFGCRRVVTAGALLSFIGLFVSTFSRSLGVLIFTYGFLGGFGFGLMYLPAIVMVGYYFERRRALATGIACCGSGIGAFCFAPLCEYLLEDYGWRGATWIISALVLNGLLFAMFYKPLPVNRQPETDSYNTNSSTSFTSETVAWQDESNLPTSTEEGTSEKALMPADHKISPEEKEMHAMRMAKKASLSKRTRSVSLNEPYSQAPEDPSRLALSTDFGMMLRKRQQTTSTKVNSAPKRGFGSDVDVVHLSPLRRKDIFYSGSLMHLREHLGSTLNVVTRHETPGQQDESANHSSVPEITVITIERTSSELTAAQSFSQALTRVFDFSLLKSPTFLIYGWACFLCMAGFFVPFVYMPTHAIDLGLSSRNAAFLISIIGITNTVGRVAVGFLSDQPWADCLVINNIALIIGGVATMFVPYYASYGQLAAYSSIFGLAVAVFVSLRSIIMVELMGLDKLTSAFGLVIMCQGGSAFLGAPLAGVLADFYGNYDAAFYLAGISFALSGISCIPLRRISRWENERAARAALEKLDKAASGTSTFVHSREPPVKIVIDSVDEEGSWSVPTTSGEAAHKMAPRIEFAGESRVKGK